MGPTQSYRRFYLLVSFLTPGRFPFGPPVPVYPQSLAASYEDSSQDEELPVRIPVQRPDGPYPLMPPPPGLPIRVIRPQYVVGGGHGGLGGHPNNALQERPPRVNPTPPPYPRPPMTLGSANLPSRVSAQAEEPRCDRFSEDICLDDFEYPS